MNRRTFSSFFVGIGLITLLYLSCTKKTDETSVPFAPVISLNTNLSASDAISLYTTEYQAIYAIGARGAQTSAPWSSLNPTGTTYDLTMVTNSYFGLNALQSYGFTDILINIPIIAMTARKLPSDLAALSFNDTLVKTRFHQLIDQIVPYLNTSVKYVSFGNEVDSYFATHPAEVGAFKELIEDAKAYIKTLKPNILVGVTTTYDGATSTQFTAVSTLNQNMDVIIMTYYPVSSGFVARDPSTVGTDMQNMVNMAAGKKIVMQEWGFPSSTVNSGSPQKQAVFVSNTINAWRATGTDKIPFISFFKRRDWTPTYCNTLTSQVAGQTYFEFMCSLGLINNAGTAKSAYQTLLNEVAGF